MSRTFYTESDILDLLRKGQRTLVLGEQDRLTDLARERAFKEGLSIERVQEAAQPKARSSSSAHAPVKSASRSELRARVQQAVRARLGDEIDPELLDRIIERVLDQVGLS